MHAATTEVRNSSINLPEIAHLADQGVMFVGTRPGMTRSNWTGWQDQATTSKSMLLKWLKDGYSLVTVAKRGHSFAFDLDNPAECERRGFKREWLEGYYAVDTPSGGEHHHGLHDASTEGLGNLINVYRVKGDKGSGKILELKLHNQSVAAPTAERVGQEKKRDGTYKPRMLGSKLRRGIHPELWAWLAEHGEAPKAHEKSGATRIDLHPEFGMEEFLEQNECTEDQSGVVNGALHVVVECCPLCSKEARGSTVAAGITKFIFGGNGYGFVCHACGVNSRAEFEERMAEGDAGFEPWQGYIYRDDDPNLLLGGFGAEEAGDPSFLNGGEAESAEGEAEGTGSRKTAAVTRFPLTDLGNAERFRRRYGHEFRWTAATGWLAYRGGVWKRDKTGEAHRAMHATVRLITQEIALVEEVDDPDNEAAQAAVEAIAGWAAKSESSAKINAALEQASKLAGICEDYSRFDAKPMLLNLRNGTLELATGRFRAHDPNDLITKQAPVEYDFEAQCPVFEKFVLDCMGGKRHMADYLQRWAGYMLTDSTKEQSMGVACGPGGNGKSTYISALRAALGDKDEGGYTATVSADMFAAKRGDAGQPFEMAGLEGVRALFAVETEKEKHLAESKVKAMTGGDRIAACRKFQDQYTFQPVFKVWLATNAKPRVRGTDDAIWDRPKLIPFGVRFRGTEREDKELERRLRAEASGILNWTLRGLEEWKRRGLDHPEEVGMAVKEWRDAEDFFKRFFEETYEQDGSAPPLKAREQYTLFKLWADETGQGRRMTEKQFAEEMERLGHESKNTRFPGNKFANGYRGLRLRRQADGGAEDAADRWDGIDRPDSVGV